jgi:hypothetical protein
MMMVRRAVIVSVLVATGVVAMGSGVVAGTSDSASASVVLLSKQSSQPLTQAQYVSKANALCSAAAASFASEASQLGNIKNNPTPAAIAAFVKAFAAVVQTQINKTKALTPPKKDRATVMKMLSADQTALNMVKANPQLLGAKQSPFLPATTQALKLGLVNVPGSGPCTKGSA